MLVLGLTTLAAIAFAVVLFPVFVTSKSFEPACMRDARDFVYATGKAIQRYAQDHNGRAPESLDHLYPAYTRDVRVTSAVAGFGGESAALDYRQPARLGNAQTLILEVRWLNPRDRRGLRPVKLWGDLHKPVTM